MALLADLPDFQLQAGDHVLHYTRAGTGTPLVLIHGSLCDYRYWRWQISELSKGQLIIAPSLAGCWPDIVRHPYAGYSVSAHAADLASLLRGLPDIQTHGGVHVLGHSRGAHVALLLAQQAPELCRSLLLADPGFRFSDEDIQTPAWQGSIQALRAGDTERALQNFVDSVNQPGTWRQMVGWFKEMTSDNACSLLSQVREAELSVDPASIPELGMPVLLIGGALSPHRFVSRLDRLEQLLPRAQRLRIPMAAHGMNLANAKAFNQAVRQFVQSSRLAPANLG